MLRLAWDEIDRVKAGDVLHFTRWRGADIDKLYQKSRGKAIKCKICSGFGLGITKNAVVAIEREKIPMNGSFEYLYKVHVYEVSDE